MPDPLRPEPPGATEADPEPPGATEADPEPVEVGLADVGALDVALGLVGLGWSALTTLSRPARRAAAATLAPLPTGTMAHRLRPLADRGRHVRDRAADRLGRWSAVAVPAVVEAAVTRVDLTGLVAEHVDLDTLVAGVDPNPVADRLDLIGLADYVIDGVDLPRIIRESTASFTSEAVRGVRVHGIEADQALARVVDRMLPHRRRADHDGGAGAEAGPESP